MVEGKFSVQLRPKLNNIFAVVVVVHVVYVVVLVVVVVEPRNLPLKFGQNQVSNSSDISNIAFVVVLGWWWCWCLCCAESCLCWGGTIIFEVRQSTPKIYTTKDCRVRP